MSDILTLVDECKKTLDMLIDMANKDKQKQVKYLAASRENAATKSFNAIAAITGGRIINEDNLIVNRSQPKLHSGSERSSPKLEKIWQHGTLFSGCCKICHRRYLGGLDLDLDFYLLLLPSLLQLPSTMRLWQRQAVI